MADRGSPIRLDIPPGYLIGDTAIASQERYIGGFGVRFWRGRAEKRGGYVVRSEKVINGKARGAHAWYATNDGEYVGVGTAIKLYAMSSRDYTPIDITPIDHTFDPVTDPFTTSNGSPIVTVEQSDHGGVVGQYFDFSGSTFNGVTIYGSYPIVTVIDANSFAIDAGAPATSSGTGGGSARMERELSPGLVDPDRGHGFGVGTWGTGTWGTTRGGEGILFAPRYWSVDNFNDIGIFSPTGRGLYVWNPLSLPYGRATVISGPRKCAGFFVTSDKMVIAYGTDYDANTLDFGGTQNAMQFANSAQGTYDHWDASALAGANGAPARVHQLQQGNAIIGGCDLGVHVALLWTDTTAYAIQYTGSTFVFDNLYVGDNCGLISKFAWVNVGSKAYWMSGKGFWQYDGGVAEMPNWRDIAEFVKANLRTDYAGKTIAWYDASYHEVCFAFVSNAATEPDLCVIYSEESQRWHTDTLTTKRCAMTRFTATSPNPFFFADDGLLYEDSVGLDANGASKPWQLQIAPVEIAKAEGDQDIDGFAMDVQRQVGTITVQLTMFDRAQPGEAAIDSQTLTFPAGAPAVDDVRVEGRYATITLSGTGVGCDFRLGIPTLFDSMGGARR